jgi:transcriptional regulator with XRE-family HTH domain
MIGEELRRRRVSSGIAGRLLCGRAKIDRSRLSHIERGYVQASAAELARIEHALQKLIEAKQRMLAAAAECGWPTSAI